MKKLITLMLMIAGLSVYAGSLPLADRDEPHGIVSVAVAKPAAEQFSVNILTIDGANVLTKRNAYWLTPGEHTFKLSPVFNNEIVAPRKGRYHRKGLSREFVINVEPGKRYSIAAKLDSNKADDWKPVVTVVEDIKGYAAN